MGGELRGGLELRVSLWRIKYVAQGEVWLVGNRQLAIKDTWILNMGSDSTAYAVVSCAMMITVVQKRCMLKGMRRLDQITCLCLSHYTSFQICIEHRRPVPLLTKYMQAASSMSFANYEK